MPVPQYVKPTAGADKFTCPYCETVATQSWAEPVIQSRLYSDYQISVCRNCEKISFWESVSLSPTDPTLWLLAYPRAFEAPRPNSDLPDDIMKDYTEAASVLPVSARSAAALLRLCIQKLCVHFDQPGKNINNDIAALVQSGKIRPMVQQAMDTVRVAANESVHPGELNLEDDRELALELFAFVNLVADEAITQPRRVAEMWARMPEDKRKAVAHRDGVVTDPE
jgi:hypothetical protein